MKKLTQLQLEKISAVREILLSTTGAQENENILTSDYLELLKTKITNLQLTDF